MKDSIIVKPEYAMYDLIDGTPNVHRHHAIHGRGYRELADELGLWVPLSQKHHEEGDKQAPGNRCDVHHCKIFDTLVQQLAQACFERNWIAEHQNEDVEPEVMLDEARKRFRAIFGKSFL